MERMASLLAEIERLVRDDAIPATAKREVLTAVRVAREASAGMSSRDSVQPWYEFATSSGTVKFTRRILWFYPAPLGWARLQRLHRTGGHGEYHRALAAALGQIVSAQSDLHASLFRTLLAQVAFSKSLEGVESIYLTLLHSVAFHGHTNLYRVGLAAWAAYGPPRVTGGDLGFSLFYNMATTTFSVLSPRQLSGLTADGILARGAELGSAIAALGGGWLGTDAETANEARVTCRDALVHAGAIVGLAASGSASAVDGSTEAIGPLLGAADESGLSIGILVGAATDATDGFAPALCGDSVDVHPVPHHPEIPTPAPATVASASVTDREIWSDTTPADNGAETDDAEADEIFGEPFGEQEVEVVVAVRQEAAEEEHHEADEEETPSAVTGDALGLISNFFATGSGTDAFVTQVAPSSFYLSGAPAVHGREPGVVALGFLGANPYVARSFERLVGSQQRRR